MTVTQYIGSRYVPVFADPADWSKENIYEPLTIVMYQGNSYTSKMTVPKGIEITDTKYWAETGNYNAQVEQYRKEAELAVDTAKDAKQTAETTEVNLATEITNREAAVSAEETRATAAEKKLTSDLADETSRAETAEKVNADAITYETARAEQAENQLNSYISKEETRAKTAEEKLTSDLASEVSRAKTSEVELKGNHIIIIGDSFTATDVRTYSWPTKLSTNKTIHNYAIGGYGFTVPDKLFSTQATTAINDSSFNNNEVGDVIVYGILNDYYHVSKTDYKTVGAAIKSLYRQLKTNFKNAKLHFVLFNSSGMWVDEMRNSWLSYIDGVSQQLISNYTEAVPFVNAAYWLYGFNKTTVYNDDYIHPNQTGAAVIANYMSDILQNGFVNYFTHNAVTVTASDKTLKVYSNNYNSNLRFAGVIHLDSLIKGNNTFSVTDNHLIVDSQENIALPYTCTNSNIIAVFYNPGTGKIFVTSSDDISSGVNIYF